MSSPFAGSAGHREGRACFLPHKRLSHNSKDYMGLLSLPHPRQPLLHRLLLCPLWAVSWGKLSCSLPCPPPHSSQRDLYKGHAVSHADLLHKILFCLLTALGDSAQIHCSTRPLGTRPRFPFHQGAHLQTLTGAVFLIFLYLSFGTLPRSLRILEGRSRVLCSYLQQSICRPDHVTLLITSNGFPSHAE